ncbi:MAG: tellurite resistance TerB family protein [Hyphomicrobiaceae bacterium]
MFDAKSLLEALVAGGAQRHTPQASGSAGGLGDLLGGLLGSGQQPGRTGGGGGLEDLLRNMLPSEPASRGNSPGAPAKTGGGLDDLLRNIVPGSDGGQGGGLGGGLGDILGKFKDQMSQGATPGAGTRQGGGAGEKSITDILGDLLGQATSGAKEGAGRIGEATGARDALERMGGGQSADELMGKLKELINNNKLGAGAVLGGLGALVLGSRTGRSLATSAAKLGALALIGGLAYRAYLDYSQGRRPLDDPSFVPDQPPAGSGFEPQATTNEQAALYIRAMIAASAADGRISADEQQKILGSLNQVGLTAGAEEFLAKELNNPATASALASAVSTEQEAVQVYTAARIAIDPDTRGEQAFLQELAQRLGMPDQLRAHIDAAAVSAAA